MQRRENSEDFERAPRNQTGWGAGGPPYSSGVQAQNPIESLFNIFRKVSVVPLPGLLH